MNWPQQDRASSGGAMPRRRYFWGSPKAFLAIFLALAGLAHGELAKPDQALKELDAALDTGKGVDKALANYRQSRKYWKKKDENRKKELKEEARQAFIEGRNTTSIERWRKVQEIDPSDKDASAFFRNNHAMVDYVLQLVDGKGTELYEAGNHEGAVNVWKKMLVLDPADSRGARPKILEAQLLIAKKAEKKP